MTPDAIYQHIGAQIREARERRRTTQHALASQASLTRTSVSNIEAGRQRVTIQALLHMAAALDVAPATLLPDLRSVPSADIDVLMERGARPEEVDTLARLLRGATRE